jgi:hypothetical protein
MGTDPIILLLAALIPIIVGAIWYNPALLGKQWMKVAMISEEQLQKGRFPVILLVSFIFSFMIAFLLSSMVIHQSHIGSLFMGQEGFMEQMQAGSGAVYDDYMAIMQKFEGSFRTFKHGMLHGAIAALFFALPVLGINALFERKSGRYIVLNGAYWLVTLTLMGGVICQFA